MESKNILICIAVILIIVVIIVIIFSEDDVSKIKAVYLIKTDSKNTQLIDSDYINLITKMTIDYKEYNPCHKIVFEKGYHYVTFYIKKTTTTFQMFSGVGDLLEINLEGFDASDVSDMGRMFFACTSLNEVRLSELKTNNVKRMDFMFSGCLSLGYVDLSKLNLENVESMESMFSNCHSLERIGLYNVKTKNLKTAKNMFLYCENLISLKFDYLFKTTNIVDIIYMFSR